MIQINTPADATIITPEHHAQAVEIAVARARQEMFEACVKAACGSCGANNIPIFVDKPIFQEQPFWYHRREGDMSITCAASAIRLAFPERSAAMDAKAGQ